MNWPVKKVYITQEWGVNSDIYARFGYKGHNGIDLRLYDEAGNKASTCLVFAPHDGVVKERANDADGYGNYLKIESDVEGSILGHLQEFKVNINKFVKQGDLVGIGDNTGWSTGAHLHWGYYRHPRNRNNGYGGTIDPRPYIGGNMGDSPELDACLKDREKFWQERDQCREDYEKLIKEFDNTVEDFKREKESLETRNKEEKARFNRVAAELNVPQSEPEVIAAIQELVTFEDQLIECRNKREEMRTAILQFETEQTEIFSTLTEQVNFNVKTHAGALKAIKAIVNKQNEQEVVEGWLKRLWRSLFNRG